MAVVPGAAFGRAAARATCGSRWRRRDENVTEGTRRLARVRRPPARLGRPARAARPARESRPARARTPRSCPPRSPGGAPASSAVPIASLGKLHRHRPPDRRLQQRDRSPRSRARTRPTGSSWPARHRGSGRGRHPRSGRARSAPGSRPARRRRVVEPAAPRPRAPHIAPAPGRDHGHSAGAVRCGRSRSPTCTGQGRSAWIPFALRAAVAAQVERQQVPALAGEPRHQRPPLVEVAADSWTSTSQVGSPRGRARRGARAVGRRRLDRCGGSRLAPRAGLGWRAAPG